MVREEKEIQKKSLRFGGGLWRHSSEHPYRQAERLICCHQDPRRLERVVLMYRYKVLPPHKKVNSIFLSSPLLPEFPQSLQEKPRTARSIAKDAGSPRDFADTDFEFL